MRRHLWVAPVLACALAALAAPSATAAPRAPVPSDDVRPLACQPYLVDATGLLALDLVSGHTEPITAAKGLTAAGYNAADRLVYAWDSANHGIGAIGEGKYEFLGSVPGLAAEAWDGGEVDRDGVFWLLASQSGAWAGVDLATFEVVLSGSGDLRAGDWTARAESYGALYTLNAQSWRGFDTSSGMTSEIAQTGGTDRAVTGTWADATRFLYVLLEDSAIERAELGDERVLPFSNVQAVAPTDGAWCPEAILEADWGDAPDSYATSLISDGPRHSIVDFEPVGQTAPLMLGTVVTPEPNPAHGDQDYDDAIASTVLVSATDAFVVDIVVTNNSAEDATVTAWLDAGATGSFASEPDASVEIPAESGTQEYQIELPAPQADTWMRLRVSAGSGVRSPVGAVRGGEVEDRAVEALPVERGLAITSAAFNEAENSLAVTVANTGNAAQTPLVAAGELCAPLLDGVRLAARTETTASCTFEPPPDGTTVMITATDGDVAAEPVELVWTVTEAAEATIESTQAPEEAPEAEPRRILWLPMLIIGTGMALFAAGGIAAKRAAKADDGGGEDES